MSDAPPDGLYDETNKVLGTPAAAPEEALRHFATRLRYETDPYDVHHDLRRGEAAFVVLDARRRESYDREHIRGARSFSHHDMSAATLGRLDPDPVYVTYGWGPGCNAGVRAAAKLAAAGFCVKEMTGGLEYWVRQGFPTDKEG
jgi:rhodanese-related sulfurtransferase